MKHSSDVERFSAFKGPKSPCRYQKWDEVVRYAVDAIRRRSDYDLGTDDYLIARRLGGATKRFEFGINPAWLKETENTIFFCSGVLHFYVVPSKWLKKLYRNGIKTPRNKPDGDGKLWTVYVWFEYDQLAPVGYSKELLPREGIGNLAYLLRRA